MPAPDFASLASDLAPTGVLRASINLGNPVLAQGGPDSPSGVTVDLATELAARVGVPVAFTCFDAARTSFEAMASGAADICFLAIEPARATEVAFTAAYVVIEGVYAVPVDSAITSLADVDRTGVRIGVKEGSAYDLYLTRTAQHATLVRGRDGVTAFVDDGLDVAAGIRQPLTAFVAGRDDLRLVEPAFMQIQQALGTSKDRDPATIDHLRAFIEDVKASGFVADSLERSGQSRGLVAP